MNWPFTIIGRPLSPQIRNTIQFSLIWTGSFDGFVDGLYGPQTDRALRLFQSLLKAPEIGKLNEAETKRLHGEAVREMEALGFRILIDPRTNLAIGLPHKLLDRGIPSNGGTKWPSRSGSLTVETDSVPASQISFENL